MEKRLLVIANIGFIIGIIVGLYFSKSIVLFLSIFVAILVIAPKLPKGTGFLVNLGCTLKLGKKLNGGSLFNIAKKARPLWQLWRYFKLYITKKVIFIFVIFFISGFLLLVFRLEKFECFLQEMKYIQNNDTKVCAVVVSNKEEKEYSDIYRVKILNINNKKYYNTYCIMKLNKSKKERLLYGDLIYFIGEFQEPQETTNFKGFSYKEYLRTINVYGTFKSKYNNVKVLKKDNYGLIHMLSNRVKISFERTIR